MPACLVLTLDFKDGSNVNLQLFQCLAIIHSLGSIVPELSFRWDINLGKNTLTLHVSLGANINKGGQSGNILTNLKKSQMIRLRAYKNCLHYKVKQHPRKIMPELSCFAEARNMFMILEYLLNNKSMGRLTWARLQQPQEQRYPVL